MLDAEQQLTEQVNLSAPKEIEPNKEEREKDHSSVRKDLKRVSFVPDATDTFVYSMLLGLKDSTSKPRHSAIL